ncbi:MAG: hypothetical protein KDB24_11710 [Microthrixaceae bacterium]|nr:hypothetical protein [Microthrixaceae bacterium]
MIHPRTRRRLMLPVALVLALSIAACSNGDGSDEAATDAPATTAAATDAADGSGTDSPPGAASGEFSVLSYNVAGLPAEVSEVDPAEHLPLISPKLNDFDVVMTQEDFDWWKPDGLAAGLDFVNYHERLRADATHDFQSPQHPGPDAVGLAADRRDVLEVGDGLGVISRLPLEGDERVPWAGCFGGLDTNDGGAGDCLSMKGFSLTRLQPADGLSVDLYNLHGEAGRTDEDQSLQAEGFADLAAYIEEHSEGNAIILGGDTNLHIDPAGPDAHPDAHDGEDQVIWNDFLDATGLTDACDATKCDGPLEIDKFAFRSSDEISLEVTDYRFVASDFVDEAGEPLSDHDPLLARFDWSAG